MDDDDGKSEISVQTGMPKRRTFSDLGKWPLLFPIISTVLLTVLTWPIRWILSGAAILTYCMILGDYQGTRILPFMPLWTQIALLNLTYAVCATSWLFFWVFVLACYPAIFLSCLFQFETVARIVRRRLGRILKQLHFINDKIAFFNIPALEIDTDVEGLLVIRGITLSLSRLTLIAHGVEVGIKLSEDMEFAVQVDEVRVLLFRRVEIGDVYANVKGGEYEMTFGRLARRATGDSLLVSDTPLLQAAALQGNTTRPDLARMSSKFTNGAEPQAGSLKAGFDSVTQVSPDESSMKYRHALHFIDRTSAIQESRQAVQEVINDDSTNTHLDPENMKSMRAAICSQLHDKPSVPHPPLRSVKVTTLKNMSHPAVRTFLHRLPFLYRLLLNPISYFHPVKIDSITAAGSGKWLRHMLSEKVFKSYGESDSGIRKLEKRISTWLSDANFVLELVDISGTANVPVSTSFDIINLIKIDDVLAFRTLAQEVDLKQVVRLGGADAAITVPTFLLPHHEHILPTYPTDEEARRQEKELQDAADGKPQEVQANAAIEKIRKDEANVKISVHARLPAVFDQELLDFIAALVKAVKLIEMEKDPELEDVEESEILEAPTKRSVKSLALSMKTNMKESMTKVNDSMRRVGIDAVANDRFIAKLVGKVTKKLETAQGDVGYSGDIPVPLGPYRALAEKETKLLP